MRIEKLRVDAFGKFSDFDTGPDPLGQLVVVLGPNEAGKSTLFNFLTTALYGFLPASRERNPHVPWGMDEAGGSVRLVLEADQCAEVERRLRSSPDGSLRLGEQSTDLRNRPVPWVEHIPRSVFRQVYAITLAELAGLDAETWARIQDRVLGSMGASDLRSARAVADELEREAGEIWRPNRRGNQRLRALQDELRSLRSRRAEALERDRSIRALTEEAESVRFRLREARAERQRDRIVIERVQELLPVKRQLERISLLREEGGPREQLRALPDDPHRRLDTLRTERTRLADEIESIDADLEAPAIAIAAMNAGVREILEHRDRVSRFVARATGIETDRVRAAELARELAELQVKLSSATDHLLEGEWDDRTAEPVLAVSLDLLRDRIERLEGLRRERRGGAHRPSEAGRAGRWSQAVGISLASGGAALLVWGLLGGPVPALVFGAAGLAAAIPLFLDQRRRVAADPATVEGEVLRLEAEVESMLSHVPLRPEYRDPAGPAVVAGLDRLRGIVEERRDRTRMLDAVEERTVEVDEVGHEIAALLGRTSPSDAVEFAIRLGNELRDAERIRDVAESAAREQERLARSRERFARALGANEAEVGSIEKLITQLGKGRDSAPLDVVRRRLDAHRTADRLEEDLRGQHPDLNQIRERIEDHERNGASWRVDENDFARRKVRVEELEASIEELVGRAEALERDAAHLRALETVDAVDSEIATLQETERRLAEERDRKWVMAQLIREADRRFREEHQPDLLKRASSYLRHLTGGKYDRLLVDEQGGGDLFQLVGPGLPAPIPLAYPVSTGTLEQAYLSLRLAIVDHLDQGNERLPLFIDEAFVNWDQVRRARGLDVLASLASSRQVFAFTCHPELAESLEQRGARLLVLPD